MAEPKDELCSALRELAAEMRSERAERAKFAATVKQLENTVGRFVVAMERQLSSDSAAQRKAERVINGIETGRAEAMKARLSKVYGRK